MKHDDIQTFQDLRQSVIHELQVFCCGRPELPPLMPSVGSVFTPCNKSLYSVAFRCYISF